MSTERTDHLADEILEGYLDGDLSAAERDAAARHLDACAACREELETTRLLVSALTRLPDPEPPRGFDVRILDAVLPRPAPVPAFVRTMTRLYGAFAALFVTVAVGILAVSGPAPSEKFLLDSAERVGNGVLEGFRLAGASLLDFFKAGGELLPLADAMGALLRGFGTAVTSLSPQYVLIAVLTMVLATLVLFWAVSKPRERGVPHVSLSL